ncbi:MAG: hypothetical protein AAGF75_07185, partial [Cyanobacteria bacterium P01_H01_bin.130]
MNGAVGMALRDHLREDSIEERRVWSRFPRIGLAVIFGLMVWAGMPSARAIADSQLPSLQLLSLQGLSNSQLSGAEVVLAQAASIPDLQRQQQQIQRQRQQLQEQRKQVDQQRQNLRQEGDR